MSEGFDQNHAMTLEHSIANLDTEEPPPDIGVYLDTNVLIDFAEALSGSWRPPATPDRTDRQRLAAARIFFYGYRTRCRWWLVISEIGRNELSARGGVDWTIPVFFDIDRASDAPTAAQVGQLTAQYERAGIKPADAAHLARVVPNEWIEYLVTNDDRFLKRARGVDLPRPISIVNALEAEEILHIQSGEPPPIAPAPTSPLSDVEPWWIP